MAEQPKAAAQPQPPAQPKPEPKPKPKLKKQSKKEQQQQPKIKKPAKAGKKEEAKSEDDELKQMELNIEEPALNGGYSMSNGGYSHMYDNFDDEDLKYDDSHSQWSKSDYTKIYTALKDLEEINVKVSIPEFVFIGFQSSGKTSAVSQAAKLAVGVMKHGTASRCPTRFKLVSNPEAKKPIITVNGVSCGDEADLTNKTLEITKQYEKEEKFVKDIIEVRIESDQVPDLTFVDLPGLMRGSKSEFAVAKQQLDELTTHYLHVTNDDGSWRYMPILVREPVDSEHDEEFEVNYIKNLVEKYGKSGRKQRKKWRNDTLFIVNKFDKQINRSPASNLIKYMEDCCIYGQTVLTMMNANNQNTANMDKQSLNRFVLKVEKIEQDKWARTLHDFGDDVDLNELKKLKSKICGILKMREILENKMCDIVTRILPQIEKQLDEAEKMKEAKLRRIRKQMELSDPSKLKSKCNNFGNLFMANLRHFYSGRLVPKIDKKYRKSWRQEIEDFHAITSFSEWEYEIPPSKLESLLGKFNDRGEPKKLSDKLKMDLIASIAINRIVDVWKAMVSFMHFPDYSHEDILNICGAYDCTVQSNLWNSVRNVVLDAVTHLVDAAKFLSEIIRYKLKENADTIFEYTLLQQFGASTVDDKKSSKGVIYLLQTILNDYKASIDNIVDDFIEVAGPFPLRQAQILDQKFSSDVVNIGMLIAKISDNKNNINISQSQSKPDKPPPKQPKKGDEIDEKKYNEDRFDVDFYEAIYGQKKAHTAPSGTGEDIEEIEKISFQWFVMIKQMTIRDIGQKLSNLVMAPIKQHDDRLTNAIHCGVKGRQVMNLINKLVDKTGIDQTELEALIESKSTIPITKPINDLDNDELKEFCGIDRDDLKKQKEETITELNKLKKWKEKQLSKIRLIKNGKFDQLEENNID